MDKTSNPRSSLGRSNNVPPLQPDGGERKADLPEGDAPPQPRLGNPSPRADARPVGPVPDDGGALSGEALAYGENFVIRVRRVLPASPRGVQPGGVAALQSGSASTGGPPITTAVPVATSAALPASSDLNNCTAADALYRPDAGRRAENAKSPAQRQDNLVFATDLTQKVLAIANATLDPSGRLTPESLGELMVAVESKGGALTLAGDRVSHILRNGLIIRDFAPTSGGKPFNLNLIECASQPFMRHHLLTGELEALRKTVWKEWLRVVHDERKPPGKSAETSELARQAQLDRVIKPVIDMICGEPRSLANSRLPEPIKTLLLSIDRHIIHWFGENGSGSMQDLYDARRSALIAFLSTRSLGYVWLSSLRDEVGSDAKLTNVATKLIQHLNTHVAKRMDDFLIDIMRCQPTQPSKVAKYVELKAGNRVLKSKPALPGPSDEGATGTSWDQALSPRKLARPVLGREAKEKEMKGKLERAKYADHLAACAGLDQLDYGCYQYIKQRLSKVGPRGFDNIRKDPIRFSLDYAKSFYARQTPPEQGKPDAVAQAIRRLNRTDHPELFLTVSDDESRSDEPTVGTMRGALDSTGQDTGSDDSLVGSADEDSADH